MSGKKISVHGPFPIGNIADILSLPVVVSNAPLYEDLLKKQKEGRLYALIPIPNKSEIRPVGIRVQYYFDVLKTVLDRDLIWENDSELIRRILSGDDDSDSVTKMVGSQAKSARRLESDGCNCPVCFEKMKSGKWLTSKGVSDWGDPNESKSSKGK